MRHNKMESRVPQYVALPPPYFEGVSLRTLAQLASSPTAEHSVGRHGSGSPNIELC